jgi:hypothetical protein
MEEGGPSSSADFDVKGLRFMKACYVVFKALPKALIHVFV